MDLLAGWATQDDDSSGQAHQVAPAELTPEGAPAYRSLCGAISGANGWRLADPGVERCQKCQELAAGTPD